MPVAPAWHPAWALLALEEPYRNHSEAPCKHPQRCRIDDARAEPLPSDRIGSGCSLLAAVTPGCRPRSFLAGASVPGCEQRVRHCASGEAEDRDSHDRGVAEFLGCSGIFGLRQSVRHTAHGLRIFKAHATVCSADFFQFFLPDRARRHLTRRRILPACARSPAQCATRSASARGLTRHCR